MEIVLAAVVLLLVVLLLSRSARPNPGQEYRLAEVERRQKLIMKHLGIPDDRPDPPGVREALLRGEKIKAVKAYREATGADLRTAKEAVDRLEQGPTP